MATNMRRSLVGFLVGSFLLALGCWFGATLRSPSEEVTLSDLFASRLHASTASSGNHFAMATGLIDEDAEGVFVLDYASGLLKCAVLNHRTGKFAATFETNVTKRLGPAKNAQYQMVTGTVNFNRMAATGPGMSVVYVLNAATGEMAAYGIPWQREVSATGRPQVGVLQAIDGLQVRR